MQVVKSFLYFIYLVNLRKSKAYFARKTWVEKTEKENQQAFRFQTKNSVDKYNKHGLFERYLLQIRNGTLQVELQQVSKDGNGSGARRETFRSVALQEEH